MFGRAFNKFPNFRMLSGCGSVCRSETPTERPFQMEVGEKVAHRKDPEGVILQSPPSKLHTSSRPWTPTATVFTVTGCPRTTDQNRSAPGTLPVRHTVDLFVLSAYLILRPHTVKISNKHRLHKSASVCPEACHDSPKNKKVKEN